MQRTFACAGITLLAVLAVGSSAVAQRFPGAATSVAVNRKDGRVAVLARGKLEVLGATGATLSSIDIPGRDPRVLQFCGGNILYVTHDVSKLAEAFVVITVEGRERLAWPNEGLAPFFPSTTSRLTLDGRGVYGFLPLDPPVRQFFGLPESIPPGAGVVATFRFAGEKMAARGSEMFAGAVALSPDDILLTVKGGGLLRYRSPGGVAWKREGSGGTWKLADADPVLGQALVIDEGGAVLVIDLEAGNVKWQVPAGAGPRVRDAMLLPGGKALVYVGGSEKPLAILDPATGERDSGVISDAFARRKLTSVLGFWLDHADSLDGIVALPVAAATTLLVHGSDGWYEVPLR
jgi:hypothetical protein